MEKGKNTEKKKGKNDEIQNQLMKKPHAPKKYNVNAG